MSSAKRGKPLSRTPFAFSFPARPAAGGWLARLLQGTRNMNRCGLFAFLVLTVFLTGCGPPGPRALLKGRKLLERGDYSRAVDEFKRATSLMSTNAQAWNYLGVADQHAGHFTDAALAYQRALMLDRDLVEAHYNLGCLWLEQNKPGVARSEFTAYVLRRGKQPEGWTKLGVAQLRLRDLTSAEKSFSTALSLDPKDAEALNGLGLSQIQRGRLREATQYFAAAVKTQPAYAPALLNLATVERQYLHDNEHALKTYRAYLALTPRRPDWEQVSNIVNSLEQEVHGSTTPAPQPRRPAVASASQRRSEPERHTTPVRQNRAPPRPRPTWQTTPPHATQSENQHALVVNASENKQTLAANSRAGESTPREPTRTNRETRYSVNPLNWFRSGETKPKATPPPPASSNENQSKPSQSKASVTHRPAPVAVVQPKQAKPFHLVQPAPPSFPRYLYLSPSKPQAGDRRAAAHPFAQAQQFDHEKRYQDALNFFREASRLDPSWFEAQYNCGVLAYRVKDYSLSLRSYETALAIRPDSEDARYNFALALKAAGYVLDAVDQLKKILAAHPNNVGAHLALGNLYAQQLKDYAQAREQYQEVLKLSPNNPQAGEIQFWLSANPP